jgi:nucleoside 2-deoxyribosyltransferase
MKKVYLAGPISGCSWGESEDWRDNLKTYYIPNVQFYSPLRGKEYLKNETSIKDSYSGHINSTAKTIMVRDSFDVRTSDALVVNFMGAKKVSIGTVMEVAWAWQNKTPVIALIEDLANIHEHSMLNEAFSWRVTTLEEAADVLRLLFNP